MCITCANYSCFKIFSQYFSLSSYVAILTGIGDFINALFITFISYKLFNEILIYIINKDQTCKLSNCLYDKKEQKKVFLYTFLAIAVLNLFILFTTRYPGVVFRDSMGQIEDGLLNSYNNHHPILHTMFIKLCIEIGRNLLGSLNAGVAVYSVSQILLMAFTFAYTVSTVYMASSNKKLCIIIALWYIIMPFHMEYSYTMTKDVPFSAMVVLFSVSVFRILKNLSTTKKDYLLLLLSSFGVCLLRNNGYFIFIFTTILFAILFRNKKKLLIMFISVLIVSYIVKYPVLNALNINQSNINESLSVPIQQISRVVVEEKEITKEQEKLISQLVDLDDIKESYSSYISDPIKKLIRVDSKDKYISNNKLEYLKLWFELGLKYPSTYFEAWVDLTKGYWNSGYSYWVFISIVWDNNLGIYQTINIPILNMLYTAYLQPLFKMPGLKIFLAIGLYTWLLIFSFWRAIRKNDKVSVLSLMPYIMNVISLLVATPVYSEFRYAYPVFCGIPFILFITSTYTNNGKQEIVSYVSKNK